MKNIASDFLDCVRRGDVDGIERALGNGANVDERTADSNTALHLACFNGHHEMVHLLLSHGANRFAKNARGEMPIDLALRKNHVELADCLRTDSIPLQDMVTSLSTRK
jgi:ankyrin repeat protein